MKSENAGLTPRGAALLAGLLLLNLLVAALGGFFTASSVGSWYQEIVRPPWNPPGWIFGPVWTALYAMIAVAAWLVMRASDGLLRRRAMRWYFIQLALNALWSPLFFGLRSPAAGLVGILLLDAAAIISALHFRKTSRAAFALFLPYIAWLLFATVLNAEIWRLNASAGSNEIVRPAVVEETSTRASGKGRFLIRDGRYHVDGEPFVIRAIGYEPGTRPGQYPWSRQDEPDIMELDLRRIKEAGFNTLRNWGGYTAEELRHAARHGLWVIQGIWVDPAGDFGDEQFIRTALETVERAVSSGRNHENILMYIVMNEPTAATIFKAGEDTTLALFRRLRDRVHELDPGVPVTFANTGVGDFLDASLWDAVGFNLYMYNPVTVSRVLGYRGYVEWLRRSHAPDKPLVITEYGLSVSPEGEGRFGYGRNTPAEQNEGNLWMHRGLVEGGADGGAVFIYADGWWKNANIENDAAAHDPDPEEWFGFVSFSSLEDTVGRPRPVFEGFRRANRAIWTEPVSWRLYAGTIPVAVFVTEDVTAGRIVLDSGPPVTLERKGSWLRGTIPASRLRGQEKITLEISTPRDEKISQSRTIVTDWTSVPPESRPVVFTLREAPASAPSGSPFRVLIEASSPEGGEVAHRKFTVGFHAHEGWAPGRVIEAVSDAAGRIVVEVPPVGRPGALTLAISTGYTHLNDIPVWGEAFILRNR